MPSENEVHTAADALHARGDPVSQKTVLDELRKTRPDGSPGPGGTERTIADHVIAWKVARHYRKRPNVDDLPGGLRKRLEAFASDLWVEAVAEASERFEDERRRLAALQRASEELRVEATTLTETMELLFYTWRGRAVAAEEECKRLRGEVDALARQLDHVRYEEYWDRVMQEVYALMPERGALAPNEIMARLSRATLRGDRLLKVRLDESKLIEKLDIRVDCSRYFSKHEDRYSRLKDWDGRTGVLRAGRRRRKS